LNAPWSTSTGNCIRALAAAGYGSKQWLKACRRVVNEAADIAFAIARTNAPALKKLDRLLTAVHHYHNTKLSRKGACTT
jgi:hypothetical protein